MNDSFDSNYISILEELHEFGNLEKNERTGIETKSLFTKVLSAPDSIGHNGIPLSNLRKIYWKGALIETLWLLGLHRKDPRYSHLPLTNTKYLEDYGVKYWRPWQDKKGNLGEVYGEQLVNWYNSETHSHINQIQNIIDTLRKDPSDRRLVANMWNPAKLNHMALPPCHFSVMFYSYKLSTGARVLDTTWIQRSADMPIGVPYNVLQYSFLNKIVSLCTKHIPGTVTGVLGNCHYYMNQEDGVKVLISRRDLVSSGELKKPRLYYSENITDKLINDIQINLSDFALDGSDFRVVNYSPLSEVKMPVAV